MNISGQTRMYPVTMWLLLGTSILPVLTDAWVISGTLDKYGSSRTDDSRIRRNDNRGTPTFAASSFGVHSPEFMPSALRHMILSNLFQMDDKKTNRRHGATLYVNDNAKNDHDAMQLGSKIPIALETSIEKRQEHADGDLLVKLNDKYIRTPFTHQFLSTIADAISGTDKRNGNDGVYNGGVNGGQYEHLKPVAKRLSFDCDITRVTLNTIIEYLRTGKVCGYRVSNVRFGVGR